MKTKSLLSAVLVLAALSRAAVLLAEEVKEKDFDDGNGGHQSAIWVDGRPVWYSDFVKEHPPKKGAQKTPPPKPAAVVPGVTAPEDGATPNDAAAPEGSSGAGAGASAGTEKAQASAAAAAETGQAKTSARASSTMSRMADAMKSMMPKDSGSGAAPGSKAATTDAKGAGPAAAAGSAVAGPLAGAPSAAGGASAGRAAPQSRTSAAPSAPAPDSPRALERRPDFFKVVSPEKYNELKNAYVLTGGSAQPGFQDIGSTGRDFVWTKSCTKGLEPCNPQAAGKEEIHYDKNAIVSPETLKNIASEIEKKPPEEDLSTEEVARIYAAMRAKVAAMEEADSAGQEALKAVAPAPPAPLASGDAPDFDTGGSPARPPTGTIAVNAPAVERGVNFTNVIKGLFSAAPPEVNGDTAGKPGRGPGWGYLLLAVSAAAALVLFIILARRRRRERSVAVDR